LKVSKDNTRFGDCPAAILLFDQASDLIQFISSQDNAAEGNPTTHSASACARDRYRCAVASCCGKNFSNLFTAFRQHDTIRVTISHVAGVDKKRLDFVWLRFNQHKN
jgi:hypothetical protein